MVITSTCSSNKIIFFPRGRKEGGDSEERKPIAFARPFLRHRLSSKDDESQKIPGLYQNVANEDLAVENFVSPPNLGYHSVNATIK